MRYKLEREQAITTLQLLGWELRGFFKYARDHIYFTNGTVGMWASHRGAGSVPNDVSGFLIEKCEWKYVDTTQLLQMVKRVTE